MTSSQQPNDRNIDPYSRRITYLRVSVTDRCNLRCFYCTPWRDFTLLEHDQILSYEEILAIVRAGAAIGIKKVRLTGGEPLLRRGLCGLIERIAGLPEISDLSLTTNGVLLAGMAQDLAKAGLKRINVSLDSLDPGSYLSITGGDRLTDVQKGLDAAEQCGFDPIKINVVAMAGVNEKEIEDFARLAFERPFAVRFIEYMTVGQNRATGRDLFLPSDIIMQKIERVFGPLSPVDRQGPLSGPAMRFKISGARGEIGIIEAASGSFCPACNRMRLTADGRLRPCLFSDHELDARVVLRRGATQAELEELFEDAISRKPRGRSFPKKNGAGFMRPMGTIGG
jgi:cyclic pyranopterin phosphate synthase